MKRLVVLHDGTWNQERDGVLPTNVARLHRLLEQSTAGLNEADRPILFYDPGVGTGGGFADHWLGGALGFGLSENVRQAYAALAREYRAAGNDRDEIYLFGFSRGAFSARS